MSDSADERSGQGDEVARQMLVVLKEAKELIRALEGTATSRVKIQAGDFAIEVERASGVLVGVPPVAPALAASALAAAAGVLPVVAPLVGVFYHASSPGAPPFVTVGDTVEQGQVVGIIEAMKVMNEVTSDYRGVVTEILVENGEAVQYEQRLMLIDTTGGA